MIRAMHRRLTGVLLLFLVGIYAGFCVVSGLSLAAGVDRESEQLLLRLVQPEERPGRGEPGRPGEGSVPYFTVRTDRFGAVQEVWSGQFDLSDQTALSVLVEAALDAEENWGRLPGTELAYMRRPAPGGWQVVFADDSFQRESLRRQIRSSVLLGFALLPVLFLFSWALASFIVRPVRRAWERQAQFVADASHELKTPLTVILSNTDMILADCPAGDAALRRRGSCIREEAGRMRNLVLDMLELARSDALPAHGEQLSDVDLSAAAETAALSFEAVAYENGLAMDMDLAGEIWVRGEEKRLGQVLDILLDNAVKYSLPGGRIRISLAAERGKSALLTVENPSEALTADQLSRLFDRFYRVDAARSLRPGCGLGLPVARQIVERWGGRIWAEHQNGTTRLLLRLPLGRGGK